MSRFEGVERIFLLAYDIIALISKGEKESVSEIMGNISEEKVVKELYSKYPNSFKLSNEEIYDPNEWDAVLKEYHYLSNSDIEDMGIVNDNDGLLLLLRIILGEIVEKNSIV